MAQRVWIVVLLFLVPYVTSLEASISCPESATYLEEFTCEIDVSMNESTLYDVKVYITGDDGGVNRIHDGSEYRRSDWYVNEFFSESGVYTVNLLIHKTYDGVGDGIFKLRDDTGFIAHTEPFEITISSTPHNETQPEEEAEETPQENEEEEKDTTSENNDEDEEKTNEDKESNKSESEHKKEVENTQDSIKQTKESFHAKTVINLSSKDTIEAQETIYTSRQESIKDMLLYGFIVFLIGIIGILLFERRTW